MMNQVFLLLCTAISFNGILIGAENASVEDYPYHVSLQHDGKHTCSAALITEQWLLTAASCVYHYDVSYLNVRVGSSVASSGGRELSIGKIIVHDGFNQYTYDNDIALIYLEDPTEFGISLQPVLLPSDDYDIAEGTVTVVTGWTRMAEGSSESELKAIWVPTVDQNVCSSTMPNYKQLTDNMICAGYMTPGVETCQGDSGAPLVNDNILVGILSYGLGCSTVTYPGVYTRVSNYSSWITSSTGIFYIN